MKKVIVASILLLSFNLSKAQTFVIQNDSSFASGIMGDALADTQYYTLQTINHLHNTAVDTVASSWIRTVQYMTTGWTTSCCDPVNCWGEGVNAENFNFPPNQNALVVVDFKPHGIAGLGVIRVKYYVQNNPSDSAVGVFYCVLDINSGAPKIDQISSIKVFPNPSENNLMVGFADEINLKNISVYDVAGKEFQVTTFDLGSNLKSVNIQNLPSGLYVMKLKCSDGSTVNKLFTKD